MRTEHCLNYMLLIIIMLRLMMEYLWCMWLMMHYIVICNSTLILSLHCDRHCQNNCTPLMQQTDLWDCLQGCWYCPQCCDHHQCIGMLVSYSAPLRNHTYVHFPGQIPFLSQLINFKKLLVECWRGLFPIGFDFCITHHASFFPQGTIHFLLLYHVHPCSGRMYKV